MAAVISVAIPPINAALRQSDTQPDHAADMNNHQKKNAAATTGGGKRDGRGS